MFPRAGEDGFSTPGWAKEPNVQREQGVLFVLFQSLCLDSIFAKNYDYHDFD